MTPSSFYMMLAGKCKEVNRMANTSIDVKRYGNMNCVQLLVRWKVTIFALTFLYYFTIKSIKISFMVNAFVTTLKMVTPLLFLFIIH